MKNFVKISKNWKILKNLQKSKKLKHFQTFYLKKFKTWKILKTSKNWKILKNFQKSKKLKNFKHFI